MKATHVIPLLRISLLLLAGAHFGCSSTSATMTDVNKTEPNYGYTNLLEMLRKEPQLMITGPSSNPEIRSRGAGKSISGSNEPLFVLDGNPVGNGYGSVRNIDVNVVESITVVSAARAGKYGARGGMGVIEIRTK
jgi:hypothetical protein